MSKKIYSNEDTAELRALIGRRVRARRRALGMTQEQLAKALGLSAEFVARIDRGYCLPSVSTLSKLAIVLQVTTDHLIGIDEEEPPMQPVCPDASRQIDFIVDRVRGSRELIRILIAVLKYCAHRDAA